ncbi:hypothetical protein LMG27952_03947 [Paraburkholderia hiiakae]|uniref:Uncharacterized protein n=1 Tax=Paraburkholderia hiiakae TaxID=1081782 RepID=A0ABN7HXA4_9BURK|nr:hypothetical protein LMG27952_03947 [Paraburkholderia hiiakae]
MLPVAAFSATLKVGDQQRQTCGILEASGQLKDVPYPIEWFNFPVAQPLGEGVQRGHFPMASARLTKEPTWLT